MKFHLQVCMREWVIWGYGKRPQDGSLKGCQISPAETQLGGVTRSWKPPREGSMAYETRTCWGWRYRSDSELNGLGGGWHLASSREECVETARRHADRMLEHEPYKGRIMQAALTDIREYMEAMI